VGEKVSADIERALGLPRGWFDNDGAQENVRAHVVRHPSVPLISTVRAGNWGEINDHIPDTDRRIDARYTTPSRYAFALIVEGDSMTSDGVNSFPAGTALIVEPERSPKAGDFVIAKDTEAGAGTFKQLTSDGTRWYLKPLNRAYPTLGIDDMTKRVIGVVIEFQPPGGKL
jgi:SOS-response transcriptional repressor LexA